MNYLIEKTLVLLTLKPQLATTALFLAAGVSGPLGQAAGIINGFGLVGAFGGLVYAGWSSLSGRTEQIKYGLMGSALCGLAWAIVSAMFTAGGQGANIQLQQPN